jgi:hypothetical protein
MKRFSLARMATGLAIGGAVFLSGCASTHQTLYYWGDYQKQVYGHFAKEKSPEEQIAKLEAGLEKARSSGKPVPPGYNAHLGILFALGEHADQMLKYFEAEKTLYPESTAYIDFLMRKFNQDKKGAGNAI